MQLAVSKGLRDETVDQIAAEFANMLGFEVPSKIIHHPCFSCFWAVAALSGTKLPHRGY